MKHKVLRSSTSILILLSLFSACERPQKAAVGNDHVITVVCDDDNWEVSEPLLNARLGEVFHTPQTETLYQFQRIDADALQANLLTKNLFIITRLHPESGITAQVHAMLPDTLITRIRNTPGSYFHQENAYAKGQALVVIIAKTKADLRQRLQDNQDEIFNFVERKMYERQTAFIYRSGEQFDLAKTYFKQYGFYLRMMHDYVEIENKPEQQLLWLGRDFPYRWLVVTWKTPDDSTELEVQSRALLNSTFGEQLTSITLDQDRLRATPFWFQEQYAATKYYGLWKSKAEVKGGPFIAYSFYEPVKDRIYCLAGIVHAPDRAKLPYLRQLEAIFRTFDTKIYEPD